jgi:hypothetical protein
MIDPIYPQREAFEKAFPEKPYLEGAYFSETGRRALPMFCGKGKNAQGETVAMVAVIATWDSIIQFTEYDTFRSKFARKGEDLIEIAPVAVKEKKKPGRKPKTLVEVFASETPALEPEESPAETISIE